MSSVQKRAYDRTSHILIVDDDETLLKFFKIHLNKFFSRVLVVKNAKEAVETIKEKDIDLILTDIRMPRVDGIQLLKKIRKLDASIPIFLISGGMIEVEEADTINELADGFLRKPFTVEEIQAFINQGIKRREVLKDLAAALNDNKSLLSIIKGKTKPEKIKDQELRTKVAKLLSNLADHDSDAFKLTMA